MLNLTATKPHLKVVFDQCGTPTYACDLATAIVAALKNPVEGIYHYSNEGVCSWYDFTVAIAEASGNSCDIHPIHSYEYPSKVERPHYSVLDKSKFRNTFGFAIPHWHASLKKCITQLESDK